MRWGGSLLGFSFLGMLIWKLSRKNRETWVLLGLVAAFIVISITSRHWFELLFNLDSFLMLGVGALTGRLLLVLEHCRQKQVGRCAAPVLES